MSESAKTPTTHALSTSWVLCLLAVLPAVFATGFTSYQGLRHTLFAITIGIALLLWGIDIIRHKRVIVRAMRASLLLFGFGAVCAASIAWSAVPLYGLSSSLLWVAIVGLGWLILAAPEDASIEPKHILTASSVGTLLAGVFGILDKVGVGFLTVVWNSPGATGTFDTMAFGASYYTVALPLALGAMLVNKGAFRILAAAALLVGGLHFGWCGDAMAFGSAGAAALVTLGIYMARGNASAGAKKLFVAGIVVASIGALIGGLTADNAAVVTPEDAASLPLVDSVEKSFTDKTKFSRTIRNPRFAYQRYESIDDPQARDYLKEITTTLFDEKPIVGHGAGGWWLKQTPVLPQAHPYAMRSFDRYPAFRSPHNSYAKVLVEFGLVGLVLIAGWILAAMLIGAQGLRIETDKDDDGVAAAEARSLIIAACWMAALGGLFAMWWGVVLESAEAAALWIVALTMMVRLASEARDEPSGWMTPWRVEQNKGVQSLVAALSIAVGLAVCIPGSLGVVSDYFRSAGDQFMLRNRFDKARTAYLRSHSIYPAHGEVLLNVALASLRMGRVTDAEKDFDAAISLRPNDARIHAIKGRMLLTRRRFKDSINAAQNSVRLYPQYIEGYKVLATAYSLSHEPKKAIKVFERVLKLNPPKLVQGTMYHEMAQIYEGPLKNLGKATSSYKSALDNLKEGFLYERSVKRYKDLKKRLEMERLRRAGKPIPEHLLPKDDGHNHGQGKGHEGHNHGGGGHNHADHIMPMDPKMLKFLQDRKLKELQQKKQQEGKKPTKHKHDHKGHNHKH